MTYQDYYNKDRRKMKFDQIVFYACVIDLLFLPYVWFISIPYTMPLIFYWFIRKHVQIKEWTEYKLFMIMIFLMGVSTCYSLFVGPGYLYKNIVYFIQFSSMFLYYFMFLNYLNHWDFYGKKYIIMFLLFALGLSVLYNIDKSIYHKVILFWNQRSEISINESVYENYAGYRYAFVFMDANNVGYLLNAMVLYLWCNEKTSFFTKVFSLFGLVFMLIACMSNGAFLVFGVSIILYAMVSIYDLIRLKFNQQIRITLIKLFVTVGIVIGILLLISKIPYYLESSIAIESLNRINANSGDSRIEIWNYIIQNTNFFQYILIGTGGVTLVKGNYLAPHNGHLYWILGYGIVAYTIFLYIIFRKRKVTPLKQYLFMVPILIGFTVNIMLGESKLMGIIMLLLACSSNDKYLAKVKLYH